jgi:hypothetical protein
MDFRKFYGIGYVNPFNTDETLTAYQKRFKTIESFEKYYNKLLIKLEKKHMESLRIKPNRQLLKMLKQYKRQQVEVGTSTVVNGTGQK